ncbi:hypothetical protein [Suttonella ornithocola]|uniref:hypothetical protein n=1 Tax=Suttonella ornithocola TaxID=279832 RepID=UPI000E1C29F9|nr:hypothetical protein [Suttonella ornithocola]
MGCAGVNLEDAIPNNGLKDKESFSLLIREIKDKLLKEGFDNFYLNIRTDTYLNLENPLAELLIELFISKCWCRWYFYSLYSNRRRY